MLDLKIVEQDVEDYIDLHYPGAGVSERRQRINACLELIANIYAKHDEIMTAEEAYTFLYTKFK